MAVAVATPRTSAQRGARSGLEPPQTAEQREARLLQLLHGPEFTSTCLLCSLLLLLLLITAGEAFNEWSSGLACRRAEIQSQRLDAFIVTKNSGLVRPEETEEAGSREGFR